MAKRTTNSVDSKGSSRKTRLKSIVVIIGRNQNRLVEIIEPDSKHFCLARHPNSARAAKLRRALRGRDDHKRNDDDDPHPIQNDWNGSAKTALISIERSCVPWRIIAQATSDETAALLAAELEDLRREVEAVFPNAQSFIRPGFDEPWR